MQRLLLTWAMSVSVLLAQTSANKATLAGFVSDPGGQPVPGATVHAVSTATNLDRITTTNTSGFYQFDAVDPGSYDIRVDAGPVGASVRQLTLRVGTALRVNVVLAVDSSPKELALTTSVRSVAESSPTDVLMQNAIENLPINGRRFQDFATLEPTVQANAETRGQLSFAGQRGVYSNVMLDGLDYNEPFLGGIRGGQRSTYMFTVPQSAIQEFQAITAGPPAVYGRTSGGVLNTITKSGSNTLHGEGFYHLRNDELGAKDPLGRDPLERQHQFGGAIGGPAIKNKVFYFAAAEQQLASYPRRVRFPALDAVAGQVTPDIAPAYNYLRSLEQSFDQTNNGLAAFGRLDYQFYDGSRIALRYNQSYNTAKNAVSLGGSLQPDINQAFGSNGTERDRTQTVSSQWTAIKGAFINDLRFQYGRESSARDPNAIAPSINAGVIGSLGTSVALPGWLKDYRVQVADALSRVVGQHSLAFGVDYNYIGFSQWSGANQFGTFDISGNDVRRILQILSGVSGNRFDDPSVIYSRQVGGLQVGNRAQQISFYGQDTWRVIPTLTLVAGLRWEGQLNPQPIADNPFLVSNVRDFPYPRGHLDPTVIRSPLNQWSPRFSLAWDPFSRHTTVIRAKAGLFYAQTPLQWLAGPLTNVSNAPGDLSLQISPANGQTVYQQFLAGGFDLNRGSLGQVPIFSVNDVWMGVAGRPNPYAKANVMTTTGENFRNPRSVQVGFSVEHQLRRGLVAGYDLNHVVAVHLERNVAWNVPTPSVRPGDASLRPFFGLRSGGSRPNPDLGWVIARDSSARSNYTGNTFRLQYLSNRVDLGLNYTLSYNRSDYDNEGDLTWLTYPNPYDFSRDYNWASIDSRHQANGFAVWHAPRGFDVSALFHYRSGLPIDPSTGFDTSEALIGNFGNRPLERPGLFMLRNSFRNRPFRTVDLRLAKAFALREGLRLQVYGDFFNLLNSDNVAFISASVYQDNPAFIYGLGVLPNGQLAPVDPRFLRLRTADGRYDPATTAQVGTPFQAQLGLRFLF